MNDFDLITDLPEEFVEKDTEELVEFIENLRGVEKLWRLTDLKEPNFFSLRIMNNGKLEKYVSLMDLMQEFIEANPLITEFDLFLAYMVRDVRKLNQLTDRLKLNGLSTLYLNTNLLIKRARSTTIFLEKINKIKFDTNQRREPFLQHWQLYYIDPINCQDKDIIDLLISCSVKNPLSILPNEDDYLNYIYGVDLNSPTCKTLKS